ncbi:MAG: hypothetical protein NTV80_04155, partial [Verrucomicrobia bacterium]|nr:hypothetical protein [Verrucomicrobiota bacterium]
MKSRYFALFFLSLLGLLFLPEAKALPPAKPTDGSVRFTRKKMTEQAETYHSYHLRWKDNAPDADGTELQLRFANAGAFYFLTNDQRGYLNAPIPDISERDADGYREAIISVGSPPPGTICQFQVVVWKFNGNKTESSSLLIQTRVPAPNGNADFAPPTNLQRKVSTTEDRVTLSWEDKSDKETYHQIFLAKGSAPSANAYSPLGYIPFGLTEWDIKRYMSFPYNRTTDGQNIATPTTLIPGETYSVAVRALSVGKLPVTDALTLGSTLPLSEAKVTNAATVSFVMPSLRAPSNLKGRVISEASVNLSWEDNSNNETSYEIQ